MNEEQLWNAFIPDSGWSKNDKSRDAQRLNYLRGRAKNLASAKDTNGFLELIKLAKAHNWCPRYHTRAHVSLIGPSLDMEGNNDWSRNDTLLLWKSVLDAISKDSNQYDFPENIEEVFNAASEFGFLNARLAIRLLATIRMAACRSKYGWEDSQLESLADLRPLLRKSVRTCLCKWLW